MFLLAVCLRWYVVSAREHQTIQTVEVLRQRGWVIDDGNDHRKCPCREQGLVVRGVEPYLVADGVCGVALVLTV
jgi:hypothetical protein